MKKIKTFEAWSKYRPMEYDPDIDDEVDDEIDDVPKDLEQKPQEKISLQELMEMDVFKIEDVSYSRIKEKLIGFIKLRKKYPYIYLEDPYRTFWHKEAKKLYNDIEALSEDEKKELSRIAYTY